MKGDFSRWSFDQRKHYTGVLHQVRAHLAAVGAPIVGDERYGGPPLAGLGRFALHASSLSLPHPVTGSRVQVECPPPDDFARALAATVDA